MFDYLVWGLGTSFGAMFTILPLGIIFIAVPVGVVAAVRHRPW